MNTAIWQESRIDRGDRGDLGDLGKIWVNIKKALEQDMIERGWWEIDDGRNEREREGRDEEERREGGI